MAIKPLKIFSSFILFAFCKINDSELVLKSLQSLIRSLSTLIPISGNKLRSPPVSPAPNETIKKEFLTIGEINMVMGQLGLQQCCGPHDTIDILSVFNDQDPNLSEVKVAFDVFDENSDGFIDEFELQRMLCKLGQSENAELEQCRNMIKGFDINYDGLVDFDEFVRLLETCSF